MHEISSNDDFKTRVLERPGFVLVDFWSPSCAPCHMFNEVLEKLEPQLPTDTTVVKVNVDDLIGLADLYRVIVMPTLKIFKGGEEIKDVLGLCTPEDLQSTLETLRNT